MKKSFKKGAMTFTYICPPLLAVILALAIGVAIAVLKALGYL